MAGVALIAAVLAADLVDARRSIASEQAPMVSGVYALRSFVLLAASIAVVLGLRQLAIRLPRRVDAATDVDPVAAAAGGSLIALGAGLLLLTDSSALSRLVREDQVVEWTSAVLAFAAAWFYGLAAKRCGFGPRGLLLAAVGSVCLLLGLEEISWFQRVLDVDSPDFMLNRNGQQEINLHNLATGLTGNLYYVGAYGWGVLLPGLLGDRRLDGRWRWLNLLVPSRSVLFGSVTAAGVVYEMWNIAWIQITFWMSLVMLGVVAQTFERRTTAIVLAVVTTITAVVFLIGGSAMVRSWDDTEIRELIIPYGLTLAGLEAARRSDRPEPDRADRR